MSINRTPDPDPQGISAVPLRANLGLNEQAFNAGFAAQMIPIIPGGKKPGAPGDPMFGWSQRPPATLEEAKAWDVGGCGVGLRGGVGGFLGIDKDITDPAVMEMVDALEQDVFGPFLPQRGVKRSDGRPHIKKTAICVVVDDSTGRPVSLGSIDTVFVPPAGGDAQKVQLIGDGRQTVIRGKYVEGGKYVVDSQITMATLPRIPVSAISEFWSRLPDVLYAAGCTDIKGKDPAGQAWTKGVPRVAGRETLPVDAIRKLVDLIPNDDVDYDTWVAVGMAIYGASEGSGYEVFEDWSRQSGKHDTKKSTERTWDSFADTTSSATTLRRMVEELHGKDSPERQKASQIFAADGGAFDVVEEETIPMPEVKKETPPDPSEFDLSDWNPWAQSGSVPFPVDTLPPVIADYVTERSRATGTDVSAFAVSALVCLSTAIDHRTKLQPKTHDPYYLVSPLLWALLVGAPSTRKSAPINAVEAILSRLDHRDSVKRKLEVANYMTMFGVTEKEADKNVPPARRRVLYDATSEKLCSVLSGQDCGVGLYRDELSGWIGAWDKYSGGKGGAAQDRGVWIRAHGGGRYVQDRISGSRMVANLSCSVLGAIQPMAIPDMGALDTDGLLQRFLPVMMSPAADDQDVPSGTWNATAFESLVETLDGEPPETVGLSAGAQALRVAFAKEMVVASGLTTPSASFGSFCGKQERTLCALALILHKASGSGGVVGPGTMGKAVRIMEEFVLPHAHTFYLSLDAAWLPATQSVAADLIKRSGGGKITQSALRSRAVRGMGLRDFQAVMRVFQGNGWVIAEDTGPTNRHWWVNPELHKFDQELKMYEKKCEDIVRKIMKAAKKAP